MKLTNHVIEPPVVQSILYLIWCMFIMPSGGNDFPVPRNFYVRNASATSRNTGSHCRLWR
jgi:hypothetical protein